MRWQICRWPQIVAVARDEAVKSIFMQGPPIQSGNGDPAHSELTGGTLCVLAIAHKAEGLQLPCLSDRSQNKTCGSKFWSPTPVRKHAPWGAVQAE